MAITLGYVGTQGASYPINTVFLWTSGPHEAVINVALRPEPASTWLRSRKSFARFCRQNFQDRRFSFEPGDLVNQIMNFGAPTPVEMAVTGPDLAASRAYTDRLRDRDGQDTAICAT